MKDVEGVLTIGNKLWFNAGGYKCLLRICGFSDEQVEKLKKTGFIDITLINVEDLDNSEGAMTKAEALISIESDEIEKWFDELEKEKKNEK